MQRHQRSRHVEKNWLSTKACMCTIAAGISAILMIALPLWQGYLVVPSDMSASFLQQPREQTERLVPRKPGQRAITVMRGVQVPFQFRFHICNGLTNQRLQLLDGVLAGLFLGAQILLPKDIMLNGAQFVSVVDHNMKPLSHIFNMSKFEALTQKMFYDFWCRVPRRRLRASKLWCNDKAPPAIVFYEAMFDNAESIETPKKWTPEDLLETGEDVFKQMKIERVEDLVSIKNIKTLRITVPCEFWFQLKVVEGNAFWEEFWKLNAALEFNEDILQLGKLGQTLLLDRFGHTASDKIRQLGYKSPDSIDGGFHVVHLRAENDWQQHCKIWSSWREKRDNCMNNTFHIGNVLLSEGISPALPVYLATGLSEIEIQALREKPTMYSFFNIYTVVTKGMLGLTADVGNQREYWAAMDYIFSEKADWFVGNSISTFSALIMEVRLRQKKLSLPYNGGSMALEDINCIRSNTRTIIPPMRPEIKWLFTLPRNVQKNDLVFNMTMVAVRSAGEKTGLIPVCVTAMDPNTTILVQLIAMGVRVIYHTPTWLEDVERKMRRNGASEFELDALVSVWLHIDIPILGLMDDFVLYTDIDVVFISDIFWKNLLGKKHVGQREQLQRHLFDKTSNKFFDHFAKASSYGGIPKFLAVADFGDEKKEKSEKSEFGGSAVSEFGHGHEHSRSIAPGAAAPSRCDSDRSCSVQLLHLRTLRDTHDAFRRFVSRALPQRATSQTEATTISDTSATYCVPCFFTSFYKSSISILPQNMVWKPNRIRTSIVHLKSATCHNVTYNTDADKSDITKTNMHNKLNECFDFGDCLASHMDPCAPYQAYVR